MIVSFFVFNKNNVNIKAMNGTDTIPLLWFWDHLSNSFHGWTAAMYLATLVSHLLTSVIEFTAYFLFLSGRNRWYAFWVATFGMWGSFIFLALPWIFALF